LVEGSLIKGQPDKRVSFKDARQTIGAHRASAQRAMMGQVFTRPDPAKYFLYELYLFILDLSEEAHV